MKPDALFPVRRAGIDDIDTVTRLFDAYRVFYGRPTDPDTARAFVHDRLQRADSVIFLADRPDMPAVGFTQLYPIFSSLSTSRAFILNDLFVMPEARRQGVANHLLAAAAAHARADGATQMTLSTAIDNMAAQRLYESRGWIREDAFYTYNLTL